MTDRHDMKTIREMCRAGKPLGGADAQALESTLQRAEAAGHSPSQPTTLDLTADEFNERYPVGTPIRFWSTLPAYLGDEPTFTQTRSAAWNLGGHTPVVMIEGMAGGVAISHLEFNAEKCPPSKLAELRERRDEQA